MVQSSDIRDTDQTKRDALQKAIAYIAKVDTAVRLSLLQRARKYRRGECLLQTGKKRIVVSVQIFEAIGRVWSNGALEEHENSLNTLKHQIFGRTDLELLRQRIMSSLA